MICPHCSFNVQGNQQVCPQCFIPLPTTASTTVSGVVAARSIQSNIQEKRHKLIVLGGIGAVITGMALLGGAALLGLLVMACGISTLVVSKFGKEWDNLPGNKKALIVPGVVAGAAGIAVGWVFLYAMWTAFKMEFLK